MQNVVALLPIATIYGDSGAISGLTEPCCFQMLSKSVRGGYAPTSPGEFAVVDRFFIGVCLYTIRPCPRFQEGEWSTEGAELWRVLK